MFLQDDLQRIDNELDAFCKERSYKCHGYAEYILQTMTLSVSIIVEDKKTFSTMIYDREHLLPTITKLEQQVVAEYGD